MRKLVRREIKFGKVSLEFKPNTLLHKQIIILTDKLKNSVILQRLTLVLFPLL